MSHFWRSRKLDLLLQNVPKATVMQFSGLHFYLKDHSFKMVFSNFAGLNL